MTSVVLTICDLFGFDDSAMALPNRTADLPATSMVGGLLWPNGFLYATLVMPGLAATIWAVCRRFWRVNPSALSVARNSASGAVKPMIVLILVFGVGSALVHVLSSFNSCQYISKFLCPDGGALSGLRDPAGLEAKRHRAKNYPTNLLFTWVSPAQTSANARLMIGKSGPLTIISSACVSLCFASSP